MMDGSTPRTQNSSNKELRHHPDDDHAERVSSSLLLSLEDRPKLSFDAFWKRDLDEQEQEEQQASGPTQQSSTKAMEGRITPDFSKNEESPHPDQEHGLVDQEGLPSWEEQQEEPSLPAAVDADDKFWQHFLDEDEAVVQATRSNTTRPSYQQLPQETAIAREGTTTHHISTLHDFSNEEMGHLVEAERGLLSWEQPNLPVDADNFWQHLDKEWTDQLLADELQKLSLAEHENILFDVHGIARIDQHDPPDVDKKLEEMDADMHNIRRKQAYERAKYLDEAYVQDRSFQLRFLRCDRFHSALAAQRMVRHFQIKQELFGDGPVLARDVLLSDLSPEDITALESGYIQILPARDAAGRSIVSIAPMCRPDTCSIENCIRAMWYIFNATMKDEETQRNGVVGVLSNMGENARQEPFAWARRFEQVRAGIPKKIVAIHYCYDKKSLEPFVKGIRLFLAKDARTRFRVHFGNHAKIMFELQTYGIPTKYHPILPNGDMSLEWHKEWVQVRRTQEGSESSRDGMILPRRFDVLFGRGKFTREHTGNLRALHLVEMHRAEYEKAGKAEKTAIAERIIQIIHESLGRFLKWEKQGWVEVDSSVAREKISHYFRHLRSKTTTTIKDDSSTSESGTSSEPLSSFAKKRVSW